MDTTVTQDLHIDLHYLTRAEGHGNIVVDARDGRLQRCELDVVEAPRFFEAMLRGRPYHQASRLASRICGICAVAHATASLRATERALGVEVSPQTARLRRLNFDGEMLDSHTLHIYMLVAPDLLGVRSVVPLAATHPDVVGRALRLKKLAGDVCAAVGGRHTHPISMAVGGFHHLPADRDLEGLLSRLVMARRDADATIELLQGLSLPGFSRPTEYVALTHDGAYEFIDGVITSSDGGSWPLEAYAQVAQEHVVGHSTAKHTRHRRDAYMVGALARFKLLHDRLHSRARAAAAALNLVPTSTNPFHIPLAQAVELVQVIEDSIDTVGQLLEEGVIPEPLAAPARTSGEGVGAVEAPRGTLYHHYRIDDGRIAQANCIIPTGQNLANIESDMRALVPQVLDRGQAEITHMLEMLVRAYDPCLSCSTHTLEVRVV
jgi:coenzyme F420-reducing hydrogenase alpha subunit